MKKKPIQHIVFDLGGVLYDIDHKLSAAAFDAITGSDPKEGFLTKFSLSNQHKIFTEYEQGLISSDDFYDLVQKELDVQMSRAAFIDAWNALLKTFPRERVELVRKLKERYQVSLLSNTNEIHIQAINNHVRENHKIPHLDHLFHKTYFSCRLKMRKPNADIFKHVIDDNGFSAEETLFIDDSKPNTDAAAKLGIQTIHLVDNEVIKALEFLTQ